MFVKFKRTTMYVKVCFCIGFAGMCSRAHPFRLFVRCSHQSVNQFLEWLNHFVSSYKCFKLRGFGLRIVDCGLWTHIVVKGGLMAIPRIDVINYNGKLMHLRWHYMYKLWTVNEKLSLEIFPVWRAVHFGFGSQEISFLFVLYYSGILNSISFD